MAAKILVAEDDKFLANAYRIKLARTGFDARFAGNGNELFTLLESFSPDVIVLDLVMPVKDGFETLKELRSSEQWKTIPVIVASNLGQEEDYDRAMALGATDFVVKSNLKLEELIAKINVLLDKSRPM